MDCRMSLELRVCVRCCAGKAGARQLEVSLRAVGQAMMELQALWIELAPHSPW